ncbi:class I SAM-dependent methyltransferase [Pseudohalioglobus lutimaris]|uniref:class I SAM-dependent methyltransferase n=1 Tax=Pseudohalioglobus lutimaris TaxID=1737061 RepID=UPI001055C508|nr:class I SAM-dependent methyltransferase [Pseudohalioglobus lutimaris]
MRVFRFPVERAFSRAGVTIDGDAPWDIHVKDDRFYRDVMLKGSLGLGEAYMRDFWSAEDLEALFCRLLTSGLEQTSQRTPFLMAYQHLSPVFNQQTKSRALHNAEHHYNLGNNIFFEFLGHYKNYSCGYFREADNLDDAQHAKLLRLCELLELNENDRLLDVGGGWGEFAKFAAEHTGCHVTSINIADEQINHARSHCKSANVDIVKSDYRELSGSYTKIAVIAMFTHVGQKNYRQFMEIMHRLLEPDGKMVMETVGSLRSTNCCEPWTNKYIFPGGVIPTLPKIDQAISGLFQRSGVEEFGDDYARTLRYWYDNFISAWPRLSRHYSDSMRLMFEYFFLSVAGAFRAKDLLHYHIEFAKAPGDERR